MMEKKQNRYNQGVARSILLAVVVAALFLAAATPSFLSSAAAATKKLPVYSVQRDDKCVSLTFDAAWGDVILRRTEGTRPGLPGGEAAS